MKRLAIVFVILSFFSSRCAAAEKGSSAPRSTPVAPDVPAVREPALGVKDPGGEENHASEVKAPCSASQAAEEHPAPEAKDPGAPDPAAEEKPPSDSKDPAGAKPAVDEKPSPEALRFEAAVKRMEELQGYHLLTRIDIDPGDEPVNIRLNGVYRKPGMMHLKIEGLGGRAPTEAYFNEDRGAVRDAFKKVWMTPEQAGLPLTARRMWKPDELLEYARKYASSCVPKGDETVRETACSVLAIDLTNDVVPELMKKFDIGDDVGLKTETITMTTRVWMGKEDGFIHRFEFRLKGMASGFPDEGEGGEEGEEEEEEGEEELEDVPVSVFFVSDFTGFGKDLETDIPPEAKELLGLDGEGD
ncbi:MAG: hypothetical protein RDV41_05155 [Planctomycetota bacterium]|nr:hypothetical protein [Planctomycetota bacterium]